MELLESECSAMLPRNPVRHEVAPKCRLGWALFLALKMSVSLLSYGLIWLLR
jgi:hypothetical protein